MRKPNGITSPTAKERLMWTVRIQGVGHDRLFSTGFASVDDVVIKTLRNEDRIEEAKVDG